MSQAEAAAETATAPTVSDLWIQPIVVIGKGYEDEDNPALDDQRDEIEWAMVRMPSTIAMKWLTSSKLFGTGAISASAAIEWRAYPCVRIRAPSCGLHS